MTRRRARGGRPKGREAATVPSDGSRRLVLARTGRSSRGTVGEHDDVTALGRWKSFVSIEVLQG